MLKKLSYLNLLQKCSTMEQLTQIHTQLITTALTRYTYITTKLLSFCALNQNGNIKYATSLFTHIKNPTLFDFNIMIMGCSKKNSHFQKDLSFRVYNRMRNNGFDPDFRTFPALARTCSDMYVLCQVNGQIMKFGFISDVYVVSTLICMYSRFGAVSVARQVFDESDYRNVVCWTSLVSGYCENGLVDEGRRVFDSIPCKNEVSCSAMVSGYVTNEKFNEAVELFRELRCASFRPNRSILVCVLNACGVVDAFEEGKWVHSYINENFSDTELELGTTLISFYLKCGKIDESEFIFTEMTYKDVTTWSAMILGLAMNGKNQRALQLFEEMEKTGPKPNEATFVGAICACNHKDFANEGLRLLGRMSKVYGLEPGIEHYGCLVDILAKSGQIKEAEILIKSMKKEPDGAIWGCLLNGCFIHGYTELAERVGEMLIQLEPQHSGRYILMSNLYASMGSWEGVSRLRETMRERRVKTIPGWSSVEIYGVVHSFVADSKSHSRLKDINMILNRLHMEILSMCDTNRVMK